MSFWDVVDRQGRRTLGRVNAGKVSVASRGLRITAAALATGVVVGSILGTGFIALPVWALAAIGVSMFMNGVAIPFSWAGNHMKVLQYEDAQEEVLADIGQLLRAQARAGHTPPKALSEKIMIASRKASDVNGVGGTILSMISGAATVGMVTPAAPVAVGVWLASQASRVVSAGVNVPITRNRLKVHKAKLQQYQEYYRLVAEQHSPERAQAALAITDRVFEALHITKEQTPLNSGLHFALYKALFAHPSWNHDGNPDDHVHIETMLRAMVSPLLKASSVSSKGAYSGLVGQDVDKQALRRIDRAEHRYSTHETKKFKDGLAPLDALAVLGMKVQDALTEHSGAPYAARVTLIAEDVVLRLRLDAADGLTKHMHFQIRQRLMHTMQEYGKDEAFLRDHHGELVALYTKTLQPYAYKDGKAEWDHEKIQTLGLPPEAKERAGYDSAFLPHYHTTMLGERMQHNSLAVFDAAQHQKLNAGRHIADTVFVGLRLNPDDALAQQFYGMLQEAMTAYTVQNPLLNPKQQNAISHYIQDAVLPYVKQEERRTIRSLCRKKLTGYQVFDDLAIRADDPESNPKKRKAEGFIYEAFAGMFGRVMVACDAELTRLQHNALSLAPASVSVAEPKEKVSYVNKCAAGRRDPGFCATACKQRLCESKKTVAQPLGYTPYVRPTLQSNPHAERSYAQLKAVLANTAAKPSATKEEIIQQQSALKQFQRDSEAFIQIKRWQDQSGNRYTLWDDPHHRGQAQYQVLYIKDAKTAKLSVYYGDDADAIVAMDADVHRNIGVSILEIKKGNHVALGDPKHPALDVQNCGLLSSKAFMMPSYHYRSAKQVQHVVEPGSARAVYWR